MDRQGRIRLVQTPNGYTATLFVDLCWIPHPENAVGQVGAAVVYDASVASGGHPHDAVAARTWADQLLVDGRIVPRRR